LTDRHLVIVAGPNGAGKTSYAHAHAADYSYRYLSADEIAEELAPGQWETVRVQAGRLFVRRLKEAIDVGQSVVVESTLSGRSMLRTVARAKSSDYIVSIVFVFLETAEVCIARVHERVLKGGHSVPDEDVIRRFLRSKRNFWRLYRHQADHWVLLSNSTETPQMVAIGEGSSVAIVDDTAFEQFLFGLED